MHLVRDKPMNNQKKLSSLPAVTKQSSQVEGLLAPRHNPSSTSTHSGVRKIMPEADGKPKAKSKNPEFRPATLYLRKKTLTEAEYKLRRTDDNRDMSDLAEELMAAWIATPDA